MERFVRTFKQTIKAGEKDGLSAKHRLANFLLTYRITPHSTTQVAPCDLFLGRSIRTHFDLVRPDISQHVRASQACQKQQHDTHARLRQFVVGQRVMARKYRQGQPWIPGTISKQDRPLSFTVCMENGQMWKRHINQLKTLHSLTPPSEFPTPNSSTLDSTPLPNTTSTGLEADTGRSPTESPPQPRVYPQRNRQPPDRLM